MKALRAITAIVLATLLLSISVTAADFTPIVEFKAAPKVITVTDAEGNPAAGTITDAEGNVSYIPVESITITASADLETAPEEVKAIIDDAKTALTETALTELVPEFETAWTEVTGGAPVENAVVSYVFDISSEVEIPEGSALTLTIAPQDVTAEDMIVVLHKVGDNWIVEPHTFDENGNIVITVTSLSPFAIVKDSAAAPASAADAPEAPKTGMTEFAVVLAVAFAGLSVVCFTKASKRVAVK